MMSTIGTGAFVSRRVRNSSRIEYYILSFLSGCIFWILLGLILFIFHGFKPLVINVFVYILAISSVIVHGKSWISDLRNSYKLDWRIICLAIVLIVQALNCFLPVTAFDALFYHLPLAEQMLKTGTLSWTPWIINSTLPLNYEILQGIGMATGGDVAVNLISWWFGLATILTLIAIGKRLGNWLIGLWAGLALSITPLWFWFGHVPYLESYLAFGFCFMTLCIITRTPGWVIGVAVGWLAGTKYWGLEAATVGFVIWLVQCRPNARSIVSAVAVACVIALFWYIKNIYLFGNPFFPFYNNSFDFLGPPRIDGAIETAYEFPRRKVSPVTIQNWIRLPVDLLANPVPKYCDDNALTWKYSGWLSFFWPFSLFVFWKKHRSALTIYAYVLLAVLSWLLIHKMTNLRYLTVILPLMYLLSVSLLAYTLPKVRLNRGSRNIAACLMIILVISHLLGPTTNQNFLQIPFTSIERNTYLDINLDAWSVIQELNQADPAPQVYFLYGEGLRYYCKFPLFAGWDDPYDYHEFFKHASSGSELARWLDEIGVDILLINERRVRQIQSNPDEIRQILTDDEFTEVYQPQFIHKAPFPESFRHISMFKKSKQENL
ncbi:MAG: hypothetical protein ABIG42_02400 [bacterium]